MVEQTAVNRWVVGSSPTSGARNYPKRAFGLFFAILSAMNEIKLVKPTHEDKQAVLEYRDEFFNTHEVIHGSGGLDRLATFEEWLKACEDNEHKDRLAEDRVPSTQYLAVRQSDGRIVGVIDVRHSLNEFLETVGGHIGYSVRESERRKGYASQMLKLALLRCKEIGIKDVLITCESGNVASAGVIKANGGVYKKQVETKDFVKMDNYWIEITE